MYKNILLIVALFYLLLAPAYAAEVVIKSTTNRGDIDIGDYWIGEDFREGFKKLNIDVSVDYRGEYHTPHKPAPKINLFMRGYTKFEPPFDAQINVLYCYYPMAYNTNSFKKITHKQFNKRAPMPLNSSLDDDWQNYDILAVASKSYAEKLNLAGIKAIFVPQFTNPDKFYPVYDENLKTDILFVGSNWHDRTSLRYAIESGFNVSVYGYNWQGIIPDEMYKAPYIPNSELARYYSSAKIVLNDHRPDMKEFGFINNRIYDATATGALVISDYMPEIEEIYGDSVPMYKNKEELADLLSYYLSHEEERKLKADTARAITLEYFTNTVAVNKIMKAVDDFYAH